MQQIKSRITPLKKNQYLSVFLLFPNKIKRMLAKNMVF